MANICITNYVIEGEKKELDALYETMKKLQDSGVSVEYQAGLGLLVEDLGKDPNEVMCRGGWTELEREGDILHMTFETALLRSDELAESHLSTAPYLLQSRRTRQRSLSEKRCRRQVLPRDRSRWNCFRDNDRRARTNANPTHSWHQGR